MIKDSGIRREFTTGAVRDVQEGKGRCDLMPLDVMAELANGDFQLTRLHKFTLDGDVCWLYESLAFAVQSFGDLCTMFLETSKHFEEGALKYGEHNWQKGIPTHCYVDSAVRHYLKFKRGDNDERHDLAFVWNILCCIWTCDHIPELNDYVKEEAK